MDEWHRRHTRRNRGEIRGSGWHAHLYGHGVSAGCRGRCSHAGWRRRFWSKAHRTAPVEDVFRVVHRGGVFLPRSFESSAEATFAGGDRKASTADLVQRGPISRSHDASVDLADFLAGSGTVYGRVQEKRIGTFTRVTSS